ncbi:MAG: hypothetical protein ACXVA4_04575, partial [Ktedonobacterales bacterium]
MATTRRRHCLFAGQRKIVLLPSSTQPGPPRQCMPAISPATISAILPAMAAMAAMLPARHYPVIQATNRQRQSQRQRFWQKIGNDSGKSSGSRITARLARVKNEKIRISQQQKDETPAKTARILAMVPATASSARPCQRTAPLDTVHGEAGARAIPTDDCPRITIG